MGRGAYKFGDLRLCPTPAFARLADSSISIQRRTMVKLHNSRSLLDLSEAHGAWMATSWREVGKRMIFC
jgi:hypothetical protein